MNIKNLDKLMEELQDNLAKEILTEYLKGEDGIHISKILNSGKTVGNTRNVEHLFMRWKWTH